MIRAWMGIVTRLRITAHFMQRVRKGVRANVWLLIGRALRRSAPTQILNLVDLQFKFLTKRSTTVS